MYVTFILNIRNIFRHKKKVRNIGCYEVWQLSSRIDFTVNSVYVVSIPIGLNWF